MYNLLVFCFKLPVDLPPLAEQLPAFCSFQSHMCHEKKIKMVAFLFFYHHSNYFGV